jgi:hypothetical protein
MLTKNPLSHKEKMALMMKQYILLFRIMKTDTARMKVLDGRILTLTLEKTSQFSLMIK